MEQTIELGDDGWERHNRYAVGRQKIKAEGTEVRLSNKPMTELGDKIPATWPIVQENNSHGLNETECLVAL